MAIKVLLNIFEMPIIIPEKWKQRKVNTIQVLFDLIGVCDYCILIDSGNYSSCRLNIERHQ